MAHGAHINVCSFHSYTSVRRSGAVSYWREATRSARVASRADGQRDFAAPTVAKAASTVRGTSSTDDEEISERQWRSIKGTASTSGRAPLSDDAVDVRQGRNGAVRGDQKGRVRDVSPDASWSYAFASPPTKRRTVRPGNSYVSPPGQKQTYNLLCDGPCPNVVISDHCLQLFKGRCDVLLADHVMACALLLVSICGLER